jgi:phenylacetate-CoA ligase
MSKIKTLRWAYNCLNPFFTQKYRICNTYGNKQIYKYLLELENTEKYSRNEMDNYQSEKLNNLISHAYSNIPYYNELMKKYKLYPSDFKSIKDLEKFPITTKNQIRDYYADHPYAGIDKRKFQIAKTGGSTGQPLVFLRDMNDNDIAWAAYLRFLQWIGYNWGDSILKVWGLPVVQKKQSIGEKFRESIITNIRNETKINAFELNENYLNNYFSENINFAPKIIRGYVNALFYFGKYIYQNKIKIAPKAVITTAETLYPTMRSQLEKYFNTRIFNNYGCGEVMSIAYECETGECLHVTDEHCIIEYIESLSQPQNCDKGIIIVTNLDNYVMPFIRYATMDIGERYNKRCSCGRAHSGVKSIEGRQSDLIFGRTGKTVHGEFFTHLLEELNWFERYNIKDFEVVQTNNKTLKWRLVVDIKPDIKNEEKLKHITNDYLGDMINIIEYPTFIKTSQIGKRRFTRREFNI